MAQRLVADSGRSPDASRRRAARPPDGPSTILDLQRRAGNSAVASRLAPHARPATTVQRAPTKYPRTVTVGAESVRIARAAEAREAAEIIQRIKANYGVTIDSAGGVAAIRSDYPSAPAAVRSGVRAGQWRLKELRAVERALKHFAPILGRTRAASTRHGAAQEVVTVSKVKQAIDEDSPQGVLDSTTLGEYFRSNQNFSLFDAGTNSTVDFATDWKQLEGTAVHELAHGLLEYKLNDFVAATPYWTNRTTKSGVGGAEKPITDYGRTNASEDFSEAVMYFFVKRAALKAQCPQRYAFIDQLVKGF